MYQLEDTRNMPSFIKAYFREFSMWWKAPGTLMSNYLAFIASAWRL
jgi:hypothetical protein